MVCCPYWSESLCTLTEETVPANLFLHFTAQFIAANKLKMLVMVAYMWEQQWVDVHSSMATIWFRSPSLWCSGSFDLDQGWHTLPLWIHHYFALVLLVPVIDTVWSHEGQSCTGRWHSLNPHTTLNVHALCIQFIILAVLTKTCSLFTCIDEFMMVQYKYADVW